MHDHVDQVSIFGRSYLALVLILAFDWAFTLIHTLQEWRGEKIPIWRNFGAVAGVWISNRAGFRAFIVGLTVFLWVVGLLGILGPVINVPVCLSIGALGFIVGGRIADTLISHLLLHSIGYRPNPGIKSTPLYVLEAIFIVVVFWKDFLHNTRAAWTGFGLGCLGFFIVIPGLLLLRLIKPLSRRERWIPGKPIPQWTSEP